MSVETEADRQREKAEEHVRGAVDALAEIVVGECYGHDKWSAEYLLRLRDWFQRLLAIRDEMKQ